MSLPSIHEMFPDHIPSRKSQVYSTPIRTTDSVCSIQGCDCATASSSNSAARHTQSAFSSTPLSGPLLAKSKSRSEKSTSPYSYDLLRSDPTAGSLKHIASNEHGPLFRGHTRHVPLNIKVPHPSPAPQNHIPQPSTRSRLPRSDSSRQPYFNDPAYRVTTSRSRDTSVEYPYPPPSAEPFVHDVEQYCDDDMDSDEYHDRRAASMDDRRAAVSNTTSTLDTMGRKHVCPTCFKRFNRPSSLRIHVNTHTGATPFKCPWPNCGRKFNVNSNMRRHYRNHITSSRNQGASLLAPSLSTVELLRINRDEVPALVPATTTLPGPPNILVSKPDGPDPSTGRSKNPLMSHHHHRAAVSYHDGHNHQYLATGEQKRVVAGSHQTLLRLRQQQDLGGQSAAARVTPEVDHHQVRRAYPGPDMMHSPPTSHSSLGSDSADDGGGGGGGGGGFEMFADDNKGSPPPRLSPAPLTRVRLSSLDSTTGAYYRPSSTTRRLAASPPPFNEDAEPKRRKTTTTTTTTHFPTTNTRLGLALSSPSDSSSDRSQWMMMITASARSGRNRNNLPSSPSISEVSSRLSSPEEEGEEGEGEVARRHSEPSTIQPRYSVSRPYFESLVDSHVSTTLRPAFMRSSSSLLHCTR